MSETIVNDPRWRASSMIVWRTGPYRPTTVHLPGALGAYGASTGATAACDRSPKPRVLCAWSWSFGGPPGGGGVHLCRRCFRLGAPNPKHRPAQGWFRYLFGRRRAEELAQ